jgi:hypothetical protein
MHYDARRFFWDFTLPVTGLSITKTGSAAIDNISRVERRHRRNFATQYLSFFMKVASTAAAGMIDAAEKSTPTVRLAILIASSCSD